MIVTHDRRFITPDDIVLEIEDGRLVRAKDVSRVVAGAVAVTEGVGHRIRLRGRFL